MIALMLRPFLTGLTGQTAGYAKMGLCRSRHGEAGDVEALRRNDFDAASETWHILVILVISMPPY